MKSKSALTVTKNKDREGGPGLGDKTCLKLCHGLREGMVFPEAAAAEWAKHRGGNVHGMFWKQRLVGWNMGCIQNQ